jgi:hypothetical protein
VSPGLDIRCFQLQFFGIVLCNLQVSDYRRDRCFKMIF